MKILGWTGVGIVAMGLALGAPVACAAQGAEMSDDGEVRIGVSLGGTGFVSLVTEYRRGDWSGELSVGTISFRELSLAVTGKRYFSKGRLRPAVGLGFWNLSAWSDEGSGSVFIFRVPVALDWTVTGMHALGLEVSANHALTVDRLDPEDDTPARGGIIPIPGIYYRYGWKP